MRAIQAFLIGSVLMLIPGRLFGRRFVSQKESPGNTILPATSGCGTANPTHRPAVQPVA